MTQPHKEIRAELMQIFQDRICGTPVESKLTGRDDAFLMTILEELLDIYEAKIKREVVEKLKEMRRAGKIKGGEDKYPDFMEALNKINDGLNESYNEALDDIITLIHKDN